jgi:hypothetical protein
VNAEVMWIDTEATKVADRSLQDHGGAAVPLLLAG